jgi:hypothetical protein
MSKTRQTYVARYLALNNIKKGDSSNQAFPMFKFRAKDDESALNSALLFGNNPTFYFDVIKKRAPIANAKYQLIKLYKLEEIELTRSHSKMGLVLHLDKEDFKPFL